MGFGDRSFFSARRADGWRFPFIALFLVFVPALSPALAATVCVSSASALQSALTTAQNNGEDDRIEVVQGIYPTPGGQFFFLASENFDLEVLGGYTTGCLDRVLDPRNTILDGQFSNRVIGLNGLATSAGLTLEGFTVRNGSLSGGNQRGAGAVVGGSAGFSGQVAVNFNIIENNSNDFFGGGLVANSDLGEVRVTGNLIVNNTSAFRGAGAEVLGNVAAVYITHNTIAGNVNTDPSNSAGLSVNGSAPITLSNNVLWGNTAPDLRFTGTNKVLVNNDVQTQLGTGGTGSTGNLSVDPLFIGLGNYQLRPSSTLINAGTNSPSGGLPGQDLEGKPRTLDTTTDMGAYEARVFTVDSTTDTVDVGIGDGNCADSTGNCTLRAAIQESNALSGTDTVSLPAGTYTLAIPGQGEHISATGDLDITDHLNLVGAGAASTSVSGGELDTVLETLSGADVSLVDLTVTKGSGGGYPGGIKAGGAMLRLLDCRVSGNTNTTNGGGIFNNGSSLRMKRCTVSDNVSGGHGGGLYNQFNFSGTDVIISDSTISGNSAGTSTSETDGGAIMINFGPVVIANSTISGNSASGSGGAIGFAGGGDLQLFNVTITNNTADSNNASIAGGDGGGIDAADADSVELKNTILAANGDAGGEAPDCASTLGSQGYNLIGNNTGCTIPATTGDQIGTGGSPIDPLLSALADNGGPTETHALQVGSPAENGGDPAGCTWDHDDQALTAERLLTTDQRGSQRTTGTACDIGAVEALRPPRVSKIDSVTDTGDGEITEAEQAEVSITQLLVTFDQDVLDPAGDGGANDVTNPANYLLIEAGTNAGFDTVNCAGGVVADDSQINVNTVDYSAASRTAALNVNGGFALGDGSYRLLVCGSTSIENSAADKLDGNGDGTGGDDFVRNFSILDTDGDGTPDGEDTDDDNDGAPDTSEATNATDPKDANDWPQPFADVDNTHGEYTESLVLSDAGIATGCNATPDFCPDQVVPRETVALWLLKAVEGGSYTPPAFVQKYNDVASGSFADAWISDMHPDNHAFSTGCDAGNTIYCPKQGFTKAQAAQMILRAKGYTTEPACTGTVWSDVDGATSGCGWMEEMGAQAYAEGCGGGNYCPDELLTFAGFAKLMTAAFALLP